MSKAGYVVQKIGYEYNDEVYHTSEYDGFSESVEIFLNRGTAIQHCKELNIKEFRGTYIGNYCYSLDEIMGEDDAQDMIVEGVLDGDGYGCQVNPEATDEQIERLMSKIDLEFYRVEEVSIYDA